MSGNAHEPGRSVTSKVAAVLMSFQGDRTQSLTAIAHRSRLPVSTAYRITCELTQWQFLERLPNGCYRIGPSLPRAATATPLHAVRAAVSA